MDNDHKVIIQKPEVKLFLQDDVYAFNREKPQVYDLEKEFAKVKAQKKHTILWPLIILFIISALLTFGITRYITYQNRQISVNVDVFEDINLRKLLDMVSRLEEQVKQAKNNKARAETRLQTELETALAEKDAEIFTIQALPISAREKNKKIAEIEANYEIQVAEINTRYTAEFEALDLEIESLQEQINAYDSANVERAQQQQAAIDSQRQLFELEKQQLTENYENTINQLQTQVDTMKAEELSIRKKITEEISREYQAQFAALEKEYTAKLNSLDPKITQDEYINLLERVNDLPIMQGQKKIGESFEESSGNLETESSSENPESEKVDTESDISLEPTGNLESDEILGNENAEGLSIDENLEETVNAENGDVLDTEASELVKAFDYENIENIPDEILGKYQEFMALSKDYDEATTLLLSLPQENDIPKYVAAMDVLKSQMNNDLFEYIVEITEDYNLKEEDLSQRNQNLLSEKADLEKKLKAEQNTNLELKDNNKTLNQVYSYFETLALANGDAGYILDVSDKNKVLVYVSPLYEKEIDSTLAYVFRKSDDLIGTMTLVKEKDFYYGIPTSGDIALALKPGDKILLEVQK